MTLVLGYGRTDRHTAILDTLSYLPAAADAWLIEADGECRIVLIGSSALADPATAEAAGLSWLVPPLPLVQIGLEPVGAAGFGRVVSGRYREGTAFDAIAVSRSLLRPVSERPGFRGTLVAVDVESGSTFSLSLWEDEASSARNVDDGWFHAQVAKFSDFYLSPPEVFAGAVFNGAFHNGRVS